MAKDKIISDARKETRVKHKKLRKGTRTKVENLTLKAEKEKDPKRRARIRDEAIKVLSESNQEHSRLTTALMKAMRDHWENEESKKNPKTK